MSIFVATSIVWQAVAKAPAGFCHPRSGMVGTLLEDLASGMALEAVADRFARKMNPAKYLRPTAAPSDGAIEAAEKLVEKLGIARAFERRFVRLDEVKALWTPAATEEQAGGGVFDHLRETKDQPREGRDIPATAITWAKFERTALQTAARLEVLVPQGRANFAALVTAVHADAPPILQWDSEEQRNPVSWYLWIGGSPAAQWGLLPGRYVDVDAITLKPSHWFGEPGTHHDSGALFILHGARETYVNGAALFPEILKSDLHGIRKTIEAHSKRTGIKGKDEPHVAGLMLKNGAPVTVRVWDAAGRVPIVYHIDRLD